MKSFLLQLTFLSFIRLICDLLLPEKDTSRYAGLGISLWMLLCLIKSLQNILKRLVL